MHQSSEARTGVGLARPQRPPRTPGEQRKRWLSAALAMVLALLAFSLTAGLFPPF